MRKAIIYSLIFHFLILSFFALIQKTIKPQKSDIEPISVSILSPQQNLYEQIERQRKISKLEKIPPIEKTHPPKKLSSIPQKNIDTSLDKTDTDEYKHDNKVDREDKEPKLAKIKPLEDFSKKADIFDKEIISKLSKDKVIRQEIKSSHGLSFSTKEFNDWGYLQRLKEKIERVWQYPPEAAEKGIFGDLYIKFSIDKKGKLISIELLRTSGYRMLDEAAIKALKDAEPFWPLPDDWQKESLTITGHFIYVLRGFYLR